MTDVTKNEEFLNKILTKDYLDKAIKKFQEDLYRETGCTIETN